MCQCICEETLLSPLNVLGSPAKNQLIIWDFSGSPVVKILCCQCRWHCLILGWGIKVPYATWYSKNKEQNNKPKQKQNQMIMDVWVYFWNLNHLKISVNFQGKTFNITVIQDYAPKD